MADKCSCGRSEASFKLTVTDTEGRLLDTTPVCRDCMMDLIYNSDLGDWLQPF